MNKDQMRPDFEKWAIGQARSMQYSFPEDAVQINGIGDYAIVWVQGAWLGWQASRTELCIELPAYDDDAIQYGWSPSEVIEAITKVGVSVK